MSAIQNIRISLCPREIYVRVSECPAKRLSAERTCPAKMYVRLEDMSSKMYVRRKYMSAEDSCPSKIHIIQPCMTLSTHEIHDIVRKISLSCNTTCIRFNMFKLIKNTTSTFDAFVVCRALEEPEVHVPQYLSMRTLNRSYTRSSPCPLHRRSAAERSVDQPSLSDLILKLLSDVFTVAV